MYFLIFLFRTNNELNTKRTNSSHFLIQPMNIFDNLINDVN